MTVSNKNRQTLGGKINGGKVSPDEVRKVGQKFLLDPCPGNTGQAGMMPRTDIEKRTRSSGIFTDLYVCILAYGNPHNNTQTNTEPLKDKLSLQVLKSSFPDVFHSSSLTCPGA